MSDVKWVKLAVNMFNTSRKIKEIERMKDGSVILLIWIKLLCIAGDINDGGAIYVTPSAPYSLESLSEELRYPQKTVKKALEVFEAYGMTETVEGVIYLSSWDKYQNTEKLAKMREYNRQAQRRSREKRKAKSQNVNDIVNDKILDKTLTCQPCQDMEEEEEEEIDKEYSFNHSIAREKDDLESAKRHLLDGKLGKGVVLLSDDQIKSLLEVLSVEEFDHYVSVVAECELRGQKFKKKTHYRAILDMAEEDRKVKKGDNK